MKKKIPIRNILDVPVPTSDKEKFERTYSLADSLSLSVKDLNNQIIELLEEMLSQFDLLTKDVPEVSDLKAYLKTLDILGKVLGINSNLQKECFKVIVGLGEIKGWNSTDARKHFSTAHYPKVSVPFKGQDVPYDGQVCLN